MHRLFFIWLREQWLTMAILGVILVFMNFCMYIAWHFLEGSGGILTTLLRDGIGMLEVFGGQGVHPDNLIGSFLAVGWRHPIIVAMLAGYAASRGSKGVAAEIETERSEFLFSLPYPRAFIVLTHFFSTMVGLGALIAALVYSAIFFGDLFGPEIHMSSYLSTGYVTFALYALVACIGYFFSSFLRQGGWALNISLVIVFILYAADFGVNLGLLESFPYNLFEQYRVAESLGGISGLEGETMNFLKGAALFLFLSLGVTTIRDI